MPTQPQGERARHHTQLRDWHGGMRWAGWHLWAVATDMTWVGAGQCGWGTLTSQDREGWPQLGSYAVPPTCPGCPTVVLGR